MVCSPGEQVLAAITGVADAGWPVCPHRSKYAFLTFIVAGEASAVYRLLEAATSNLDEHQPSPRLNRRDSRITFRPLQYMHATVARRGRREES